jgi:hypothetical protein
MASPRADICKQRPADSLPLSPPLFRPRMCPRCLPFWVCACVHASYYPRHRVESVDCEQHLAPPHARGAVFSPPRMDPPPAAARRVTCDDAPAARWRGAAGCPALACPFHILMQTTPMSRGRASATPHLSRCGRSACLGRPRGRAGAPHRRRPRPQPGLTHSGTHSRLARADTLLRTVLPCTAGLSPCPQPLARPPRRAGAGAGAAGAAIERNGRPLPPQSLAPHSRPPTSPPARAAPAAAGL